MRGGGGQHGAMAMAMAMGSGHVTAETVSWRRRAGLSRVLLYNALSVAGIDTKSDVECTVDLSAVVRAVSYKAAQEPRAGPCLAMLHTRARAIPSSLVAGRTAVSWLWRSMVREMEMWSLVAMSCMSIFSEWDTILLGSQDPGSCFSISVPYVLSCMLLGYFSYRLEGVC